MSGWTAINGGMLENAAQTWQGWVVVFVASHFSSTDVSMSYVQLAIMIARC
jgi:hypothetical protein